MTIKTYVITGVSSGFGKAITGAALAAGDRPEAARMNLTEARRLEAIRYLGADYVLHPQYKPADHPWHSSYARIDVMLTILRVEDHKQWLRLAHSARVA